MLMHDTVLSAVDSWVSRYKANEQGLTVLELGAKDHNGSIRGLFSNTDYLGVDIEEGPGVDIVASSHDLLNMDDFNVDDGTYDGDYRKFDIVVCLEMLEHDIKFWRTMYVIGELLAEGGLLFLSARGATVGKLGQRNGESMWEHGYPHDYWRFLPQSVPELHDMAGCDMIEHIEDTQHPGFISLGHKR
jgi:hypothetical protein